MIKDVSFLGHCILKKLWLSPKLMLSCFLFSIETTRKMTRISSEYCIIFHIWIPSICHARYKGGPDLDLLWFSYLISTRYGIDIAYRQSLFRITKKASEITVLAQFLIDYVIITAYEFFPKIYIDIKFRGWDQACHYHNL